MFNELLHNSANSLLITSLLHPYLDPFIQPCTSVPPPSLHPFLSFPSMHSPCSLSKALCHPRDHFKFTCFNWGEVRIDLLKETDGRKNGEGGRSKVGGFPWKRWRDQASWERKRQTGRSMQESHGRGRSWEVITNVGVCAFKHVVYQQSFVIGPLNPQEIPHCLVLFYVQLYLM